MVAARSGLFHGFLTVGRRIADRIGRWRREVRETLVQPLDDACGIIDRQCRLGDEAEIFRVRRRIGFSILDGLDQRHSAFRQLPHRADHFRMSGMADQHHMAAELLVAHGLLVHLGDQRACGVEVEQITLGGIGRHRFRHAMGGKDNRLLAVLRRDFVEFLDKDRAFGLKSFDDIAIVNDLVADIDRRAVFLQRQNDDLDSPVDAGAEATRAAQAQGDRCLCWKRSRHKSECQ